MAIRSEPHDSDLDVETETWLKGTQKWFTHRDSDQEEKVTENEDDKKQLRYLKKNIPME